MMLRIVIVDFYETTSFTNLTDALQSLEGTSEEVIAQLILMQHINSLNHI